MEGVDDHFVEEDISVVLAVVVSVDGAIVPSLEVVIILPVEEVETPSDDAVISPSDDGDEVSSGNVEITPPAEAVVVSFVKASDVEVSIAAPLEVERLSVVGWDNCAKN